MYMKAFAVLAFANAAFAICPGYNYGVGNVISLGSGVSRWFVYDANCNHVDSLTTTLNPCNSGTFTCTPPPITFNSYTNIFNGLKYACRPDLNSGSCGSDKISVCCRNDGN